MTKPRQKRRTNDSAVRPRICWTLPIFIFLSTAFGCSGGGSQFDTDPISVDLSSGVAMGTATFGGDTVRTFVLDPLSPINVVDSSPNDLSAPVTRQRTNVLWNAAGANTQPRAQFDGIDVFHTHPCEQSGACSIGNAPGQPYDAILGSPLLSRVTVRLNLVASEIRLLPLLAGDTTKRTQIGDAVFPRAFFGQGVLFIENTEVSYQANRPIVGTCFASNPTTINATEQGVNGLWALSTAIPTSIVTESVYERYVAFSLTHTSNQPSSLSDLRSDPSKSTSVLLPAGELAGLQATISSISFTANSSTGRGPCAERYANWLMTTGGCDDTNQSLPDTQPNRPADTDSNCPCRGSQYCFTGASVTVAPTNEISVVVVADDATVFQSLRDEVVPSLPDINGIAGVDVLQTMIIDLDYPNGRIVARCDPGAECTTTPAFLGAP